MKKPIAIALSALSLAALAKTERLLTVQVAGVDALVAAATQIGTFSGNTLVGLMVSSSVPKMPGVDTFGTGRPGAAMTFSVFGDAAVLSLTNGMEKLDEEIACALVYPVAVSESEFLDEHRDAKKKDGVITLGQGVLSKVVFSKDGRWAAMAKKASWAKQALADAPAYTRGPGRSIFRVTFEPAVLSLAAKAVRDQSATLRAKPKDRKRGEELAEYADILDGLTQASLSMDVSARGIDFGGRMTTVKGSMLGHIGRLPLGDAPLAFAPTDAVAASAVAANCGAGDIEPIWREFVKILKTHKIDITPFFDLRFDGTRSVATLDPPALVAFAETASTNGTFEALDIEALGNDLQAIGQDAKITAEGPAQESAFVLKGYRPAHTPAARFKLAMGNAGDRHPFSVGIWSAYAVVRGISAHLVPCLVTSLPRQQRVMFETLVMSLPNDIDGGIATMGWREGDDLVGLMRFSAGEIKGLSTLVNAGIAFSTMQSAENARPRAKGKAKARSDGRKAKGKAKPAKGKTKPAKGKAKPAQ